MRLKPLTKIFFLIMYFISFGASGYAQEPTTPVIDKIFIEVKDAYGQEKTLNWLARDLLCLHEGNLFSDTHLQKTIDALQLSKRFEEVFIDSKEEKDKISLFFTLRPYRLIKDIKINGEYPLFEKDILNAMTIYTGDVFVQEQLARQKNLIREVFIREGFYDPTITIDANQDQTDGHFVVDINIETNGYYRLKNLKIAGNRAFSDTTLKSKMKIWRISLLPGSAGRFTQKNIEKDIDALTNYYRKKKFADASVSYKITRDDDKKSVSVSILIEEGPRYDIHFSGNKKFSAFTLKKDLVLFDEGNRSNLGLKKAIKKIQERYRIEGYLETSIRSEEKLTPLKKKLRFVIQEGPCSRVRSFTIKGNHAFNEETIKKQLFTQTKGLLRKGTFDPERFEDELSTIKTLYLSRGYLDTKVTRDIQWSQDKRHVSITLNINEGPQTTVSSVKISGITSISENEAYNKILLKTGSPFNTYLIRSDENSLSVLIAERGYPHVKVKGDFSISEDRSRAQINYTADEGPYIKMGNTYYSGNFLTKEKVFQKEIEMNQGDPFSLRKMLEGQRNIRNLDIVNAAQFKAIGLKEKKEDITLLVDIEEKKPYYIQASAGYETEKGLFANTKVGDHNLFGLNKDIWIEGGGSQIGYKGELGLTDLGLFGSDISASYDLYTERKAEFNLDFETITYGSSLGLARKWGPHVSANLNFRLEQKDQNTINSTSSETDEFEPRAILTITPSLAYDTRDIFVRPQKGVYSSLSVDISEGMKNSLDNFCKYTFDLRYYVTPMQRVTVAWLGRIGYLDPFGTESNIPEDQLFFLGGTSDVRGFDENMLCFDAEGEPLGGLTAVNGSIETRIYLGHKTEFVGFYDIGSVSDEFNGINSETLRSSAGTGLRYITPIGPLSFVYGFKLDRREGESPGRFHFSFGYTF